MPSLVNLGSDPWPRLWATSSASSRALDPWLRSRSPTPRPRPRPSGYAPGSALDPMQRIRSTEAPSILDFDTVYNYIYQQEPSISSSIKERGVADLYGLGVGSIRFWSKHELYVKHDIIYIFLQIWVRYAEIKGF